MMLCVPTLCGGAEQPGKRTAKGVPGGALTVFEKCR
jgi:hypothetical protein